MSEVTSGRLATDDNTLMERYWITYVRPNELYTVSVLFTEAGALKLFVNVHRIIVMDFVFICAHVSCCILPRQAARRTGARVPIIIPAFPGPRSAFHNCSPHTVLFLGHRQRRRLAVENQLVSLRPGGRQDRLRDWGQFVSNVRQERGTALLRLDLGNLAFQIVHVDRILGVVQQHLRV
jgi:hypothetical protein